MISFYKAHGLGNDFVIFEAHQNLILSPRLLCKIADRRHGVGCDQIIVYHQLSPTIVNVRFYNADGSETAACGNGSRALGKLLFSRQTTGFRPLTFQTAGGILIVTHQPDDQIQVKLPTPNFHWMQIPQRQEGLHDLPIQEGQISPYYTVNVGNPHLVSFVENVDLVDVERLGPLLEVHPLFPHRINVSFGEIINDHLIKLTVWERGSGFTGACGTAACAVVVVGIQQKLIAGPVQVQQSGGNLLIDWQTDGAILMSGTAAITFQGELDFGALGVI